MRIPETDELGRDMELAEALAVFDPATRDPNHWLRFRGWVMAGAARELARRRLLAQLTVGDVLLSWSRAVVPTAVLTAMVAGVLLLRSGAFASPPPIGVEELLVSDLHGETIPVLVAPQSPEAVAFASEVF